MQNNSISTQIAKIVCKTVHLERDETVAEGMDVEPAKLSESVLMMLVIITRRLPDVGCRCRTQDNVSHCPRARLANGCLIFRQIARDRSFNNTVDSASSLRTVFIYINYIVFFLVGSEYKVWAYDTPV